MILLCAGWVLWWFAGTFAGDWEAVSEHATLQECRGAEMSVARTLGGPSQLRRFKCIPANANPRSL